MARRGPVGIDISGLGDARLQARLKRLDAKVQKKVVRKALRAGAKMVLAAARALVSADTGALRAGLKPRALKARRGTFGVQVMTPTREQLGIPADASGYYPAVLEYGAEGHPARPFLRPALDQARSTATSAIREAIVQGIDEAAK